MYAYPSPFLFTNNISNMKYIQVFALACLLSALNFAVAFAQAPGKNFPTTKSETGPSALTDDPNAQPASCEAVLPSVLAELQKEADKNCKTAVRCIPCTDRSTGYPVYVTLYAEPKTPRCNVITGEEYLPSEGPSKLLAVRFEVLQSVCTKEGVTLTISFPDPRVNVNDFDISWEMNQRIIGRGQEVNCVCGKIVNLTVTERATGRAAKKQLTLSTVCSTTTTPKD